MKYLKVFEKFENKTIDDVYDEYKNSLNESYTKLSDMSLLILEEKNIPTNPSLWSDCKSWAKAKYDVWPSAYACGAAAKRYKSKGGKWKKKEV